MKASCGSQGFGGGFPVGTAIFASEAAQVVGINRDGPMAPPQPLPIGQESGMDSGLSPRFLVMRRYADSSSRLELSPGPGMIALQCLEGGSPGRLQVPIFLPKFDSWVRIAKINAGLTPVLCEAAFA